MLDLKRLCNAVLGALHEDLEVGEGPSPEEATGDETSAGNGTQQASCSRPFPSVRSSSTISTLDPALDASLHGGIQTGYITEITGEAGVGKTQLLLSLLLAVQLPPPHGTGRRALYISTEAPLSTRRLTQMLANNPLLASLPADVARPSLDNITSTTTPDLESQEHILTYQVPVEVERRKVGLIVLDSVAANYRAEFDRSGKPDAQSSNMGARGTELVRLGMLLRGLARTHNLAVVVSNQVADRFGVGSPVLSRTQPRAPPPPTTHNRSTAVRTPQQQQQQPQESPLAARSTKNPNPQPPLPAIEPTSSMADVLPRSSLPLTHEDQAEEPPPPSRPPPPPSLLPFDDNGPSPPALTFDHQQRWFTGWGDDPRPATGYGMKTPSLGLVWATQVACRIALFKAPRYGRSRYAEEDEDGGAMGMPMMRNWRRWMKIVFAPHVAAMSPGLEGAVEYEIGMGGLKGVVREGKKSTG